MAQCILSQERCHISMACGGHPRHLGCEVIMLVVLRLRATDELRNSYADARVRTVTFSCSGSPQIYLAQDLPTQHSLSSPYFTEHHGTSTVETAFFNDLQISESSFCYSFPCTVLQRRTKLSTSSVSQGNTLPPSALPYDAEKARQLIKVSICVL